MKDPVADETLQYLLIGTDAGDPAQDENGRSDSLMLLHLNEERDEAYVISIPRNLMVTIPGKGVQPVNAAFALGQAPLVVRTLEQLTGARVDHVAMIDFQGFVNLTQDLEGVTVKNRVAFSSNGHTLPGREPHPVRRRGPVVRPGQSAGRAVSGREPAERPQGDPVEGPVAGGGCRPAAVHPVHR